MAQQIDIVANLLMKVDGAEAGINKLKSSLSKLKMPEGLENSFKKSFSNLDTIFAKYRSQVEKGFNTKGDVSAFTKTNKELDAELNRISRHFTELTGKQIDFKVKSDSIVKAEKDLQNLIDRKNQLSKETLQIKITGGKNNSIEELLKTFEKIAGTSTKAGQAAGNALVSLQQGNLSATINYLKQAETSYKKLGEAKKKAFQDNSGISMGAAIQQMSTEVEQAKGKFDNLDSSIDNVTNDLTNFRTNQIRDAGDYVEKQANSYEQLSSSIHKASGEAQEYARTSQSMSQQLGDLQQSTQYFFSLRNMLNLFRRGVQDAIQSVKELDAAMTDTAVVTDYKVSDLWGMLPQYTQLANQLGATTQGAYETMTLYFQQGLDQQAAFEIGAETMKMARIAGLEYAETTDMMTAALRGFNMELDETSAKRINDVYSKLAAITASDTEELGKAMQRTASIAHSAGMSFEGTTAFLAQAIETTREPAENIGTAMKTIVARFQEMKKNPLEISEVEGEEVDFNKVDAALKTIGVNLKDTNGQFRELDKVFLDISQHWDGLTQTQQRYIATVAAGSRQQSRFIAMMDNYDRTMELMSAANNSAGASDEQFGKTMDSLEAKLNKLHNAWQAFTMGIANDKAIKVVVDGLTKGLEIVNNFIGALTKFDSSGIAKSILSLSTAFIGLRIAGKGIGGIIGKAAGFVDPSKPLLGGKIGGGTDINGQPTRIQATITNPIIAAIREVTAAIKHEDINNRNNNNIGTLQDYKNSQNQLKKLIGLNEEKALNGQNLSFALGPKSLKYTDVTGALQGLSDSQQREIMGTFPGLQKAMQASTMKLLKNSKLSSSSLKIGTQITTDIIKGMNQGTISAEKGIELLRSPHLWGQTFAGQFNEAALKEIQSGTDPFLKAVEQNRQKYLEAHPQATEAELAKRQADFEKGAQRQINYGLIDQHETFEYTKYDQLADRVGRVGSGFATAGQSVQQFGLFLSNLGLEETGNALMRVGTAISSLGMTFGGLGKVVGNFSERWTNGMAAAAKVSTTGLKGVAESGGAFASAFTAGISPVLIGAAVAAAIVGAIALIKNHLDKKAKEAGEEVRKNFEDGFTKNQEKIDNISSYQDRFNQLSQGVDEFGHNVSLSTEDYDEYLNISKELSEISPSLIAGYNAEGQAILKKGAAIDEVIQKLEEEKKLALDSYTSTDSIDKLIKEYQTSDTYKDYHRKERNSSGDTVRAFQDELDALSRASANADLDFGITDAIEQLGGGSVTSLSQLSGEQMQFVSQHYNDILNLIEEENGTLDTEVKEGLKNAFGNLGGALNDVKTEGQPIIDAMRMWMGSERLDVVGLSLGEEFADGFNQGFDAIMIGGLTNGDWKAEDYQAALRNYAEEWKKLGGATSEYNSILQDASKIQDTYLDEIGTQNAVENYQNNVEGLATQLENLADKYKGTGQAGKIFAEQCLQQANALRTYATEGAVSLGEALNILSGKFTEARGAKERFDKATEGGDYYTAAEGFRSIAETVLDEKNSAGDGSLTAWTGAEALLGQQFVDTHDWNDIQSQVKKVNKLFDDGVEGVYNFNDMLVEAVNSGKDLKGLGEVVDGAFHFDFNNVDNLKQYADLLGISEDVLAGMIDKSRQFMAFNAGNNAQIRQALEQSGQSMTGQTYGNNGKSSLYMAESSFREEAYRQGIRGDDYTKTVNDLQEEQNVQLLTVDSLTAKSGDGLGIDNVLKDIGLQGTDKNLENTVSALTKMGFSLDEQKQILTSDGLKLADGEVSEEQIDKAYQEQEFAVENPTVAGIADNTGVIASAATAILASMGIITDQTKQDIENSTSDETIKGYLDSLSKEGEGFSDSTSRNEARASVQSQIDDYNETISLLQQGVANGNESLQPYIDQLTTARDQLQEGLDNEAEQWKSKLSEASNLVKNIGTEAEQTFLSEKAVDIGNIFEQEDITAAATALRQLEEEGNLSYSTMSQLATEFLNLRQADLGNLNIEGLDNLCTTLGLTKDDATALLQTLQSPFVLQGRLEGQDLISYIEQCDALTTTDKTILLNATLTGDEKVSAFIDNINKEFGDGTEKTKTIILEAEAKLANGDQQGAEQLLIGAGFNENEAKEITERLSITVDGSVANPGEVQQALTDQLNSMDLKAEVKARVSAKLEIKNQAKAKDQTATVNYKKGSQARADNQTATVNYKKGTQDKPDNQTATVDYSLGSIPSIPNQYVNIYPRLKGSGTYTVTASGANGINNTIKTNPLPTFNSMARGSSNKIWSKSKDNLTLTGEKGFEIAWLPSENRSMILGANGPQMLNLPPDAVVYTHEQSKKIIKQKAISINSFAGGTLPKRSSSTSKSSNGGGGGSGGGQDSGTVKQNAKNANNAAKVIQKIGYVSVWWENMSRRVDATQKKYDKNAKDLEKRFKTIGTTINSVKNLTDAYRKNLNLSIALNKQEVEQANFELKELKRGKNWRSKQEISYSIKDDNDKNESKKETVDLGNFITYNSTYGTWEISQKAIDLVAKGGKDSKGRRISGNKEKAEAIKQSAEKEINDRNSKLKTAEENIAKAQEALEKLSNDMYETFYRWEKSINKIYLLSQRLETLGKQQTIQTKVAEIEYAKMSIGIQTAEEAQQKVNKALQEQNNLLAQEVHGRDQAIVEARQEFDNALNFKIYEDIYKANKNSPTAQGDFEAAKMAFNLLSKAGLDSIDTFDYSKALAQLNSQRYSKETYDAIKQVLDKIFEKQNNLNDSVVNAEDTVLKVYQQLEEYQTTITDFEESLLDGMEKEAEKQISRLDKINTTLSKAYKELIDEVKNKLDERRKQEDNQKTESELSQKQQRLSMLRADTSGGHAVEIAQLEKEIADAQQNYQRSLEDQLIEKLQRQGDEAEKQRQKQIDLLSIQNEIAKETGTNLAEVKELLSKPTSNKDAIKKIWLANQGYDETTIENQKKLENEFEVAWSKYVAAWTQKNELMSNDALIGTFADISKYDDAIYKKLDSGIINVKLTDAQKKQVGWTATDFAKDGKTFNQLLNLGFTQKGAVQGLANAKGLDWVIDNLHATAKALTADYGFTLAQVQKAYNQSQTSKTNKNYMTDKQTGAVATLTKNGKNVASTALPASGSWIQARNGSTLYSQELNRTTGEWEKDAAQYSIGAINAQQISTFGNLGKQALLSAIQTTGFGGFINKQFKSLVQATKLAGTEVKLANGWTGSIGSDGLIYQNYATGVKKWNPATKAITEDKYNDKKKAAFLAVAKRNSETSREYAQVLMNNKVYTRAQLQKMGVKKFRTGGLADYTGPAWLDGTPAKPELVLNAQDTKNFIALKDVLSKAIGSTSSVSNEYGGDATYEININVDHLNSDYDVDKVAERVKKIIVKDSSYRNVTQVRKFR